jgi:hypothetical protein
MSLSTNDPDLAILNGQIQALENEISAYKDGLTIQEIRNSAEHRAYLNPLNGQLAIYLASKERIEAQKGK